MPDAPPPAPRLPRPGQRRRRAALLLALLIMPVLLTGCTRIRTALAVQSDDTVAGDVVIARAGGPAPRIAVPAALEGRVDSTPYRQDGYTGVTLRFDGLRFDELNSLAGVAPEADGRFRFALRRTGNLVSLSGQVDLTAMPVDQADVQLKVAFPGNVVNSDGEVDAGQVGWVFSPGQVNEFNAVVGVPDPAAPSITRWTLLVGAVVAATAVGVVLAARAQRNPPPRLAAYRESGRGNEEEQT